VGALHALGLLLAAQASTAGESSRGIDSVLHVGGTIRAGTILEAHVPPTTNRSRLSPPPCEDGPRLAVLLGSPEHPLVGGLVGRLLEGGYRVRVATPVGDVPPRGLGRLAPYARDDRFEYVYGPLGSDDESRQAVRGAALVAFFPPTGSASSRGDAAALDGMFRAVKGAAGEGARFVYPAECGMASDDVAARFVHAAAAALGVQASIMPVPPACVSGHGGRRPVTAWSWADGLLGRLWEQGVRDGGACEASCRDWCLDAGEEPGVGGLATAEIVVVRGKGEDVSWLDDVPGLRKVIYEKLDWNASHFFMFNVGDEAVPYVFHIVRHYWSLPDVVVFSQGDPFDHVRSRETFRCLVRYAKDYRPPYMSLSKDFVDEVVSVEAPFREGNLLSAI
jgi:hypothetical protein